MTKGHKLLAFALGLPGAHEDHPWGETVAKVGKKVFVFGLGDAKMMSVKLTDSHAQALQLTGATPTGYGLGRSGWVTVLYSSAPYGVLEDFVEESYRNVAPKKLVVELDEARGV